MAEERQGHGGGSAAPAGSAGVPGPVAAVAGGGTGAGAAAGTAAAEAARQNLNRQDTHSSSRPRGFLEVDLLLGTKLRYRSRQRGLLELDLLVGKWVEQHLPALNDPQLTALGRLMDEESPDLFKWFTGQQEAPQHVAQNPVYLSIRSGVDQQLHLMNPAVKAAAGMPWVRAWDDPSTADKQPERHAGTPPAGNQ